jgi:hypothetical protein
VVINQVETRFVDYGSGMLLCNGKTNGVGKALSKRPSCHFDAIGIVSLRVAGGKTVYSLYGNLFS